MPTVKLSTIKRGLLLFWAAWYTLVLATNVCDGLKALGLLTREWAFASGNFAQIGAATAKFALPAALNAVFFVGVLSWQAAAVALFWIAFARARATAWKAATTAFAVGLGLWASFVLADELFITYESGAEATHLRLFVAQLVCLLAIHLLPDASERTERADRG